MSSFRIERKLNRIAKLLVAAKEGFFYKFIGFDTIYFYFNFFPNDRNIINCSKRLTLIDGEFNDVVREAKKYGIKEMCRSVTTDNELISCYIYLKKVDDTDETPFYDFLEKNFQVKKV